MKKLIYTLLICLLSSCLGVKKIAEKTKTTKEETRSETTKDSISTQLKEVKEVTEVVAPIEKESSISLKTADSIANKRINEALRNFKYIDKSGGNSVSATYDEETMQILLKAYVAQTQNKDTSANTEANTSTNTETNKEKTFEEKSDEYIYKKIVTAPWWLWVLIYFLFLDKKVVGILGGFIPRLKGATSILALLGLLGSKKT